MSEDDNIGQPVVFIDLSRLVNTLYVRQTQWCIPRGLTPMTIEQCEQWGRLQLDDILNTFMEWAQESNSAHDYLVENVYWYLGDAIYDFGAAMLDDIRFTYLKHPVIHQVGSTWKVWSVSDLGGDLVITRGMDYRVMEWYRLTGKEIPDEE